MSRAQATAVVPGRIIEAEELWYDQHRWAAWVDGFGHINKLEGDWPDVGARLVWDSPPRGRGRVQEVVTAYEARTSQTREVEDERPARHADRGVRVRRGRRGPGHAHARLRAQAAQRLHAARSTDSSSAAS